MVNIKKIAVVGGDLRQIKLAESLLQDGFDVSVYGFDRFEDDHMIPTIDDLNMIKEAESVILPLPVTNDDVHLNMPMSCLELPLKEVLSLVNAKSIVFGGMISRETIDMANYCDISLIDYYNREELIILNALPTAEGAIQIAMEELPITLWGSRVLVLGFGRVGKILANRLYALGCSVYVAARKASDKAWIKAFGYTPVSFDQLDEFLHEFTILFNTVPARVLSKNRLALLKKDCLIIDLASKPGGVDMEAAVEAGVKTIWALSLPGKVAPITSGEIIKETIINIFKELE
ncbi:Dipicolinate synthase subunit A [bioreactor metagenome]|uniref:Dipicolinate synthase subunit A n=1 Tax=bioreactor metagenome TaxID=1076179 RepID=A0A644Z4X2_9ZZZZ